MPTPQDLERLRGLLAQLTAVGNARRGELIRADDWNTLVAAVEDVARAVLAADPAAAVAAHEHLDQVTAAWLSPDLRELLERGPLADPAVQKRLTEIEQLVRRTREAQDTSDRKVEEFRGRLTDVAARDVERQAAVTSVRRAIDSVADPRPELQNMRSTLGVIQRDMSTVLDAASRLTVGGAVVDMGTVVTRIGELEQLRDRFRSANGELLDAATIETRIAELGTRSISQEQLDTILDTRPATLSDAQLEGLETRVGGELRGQVTGTLDSFRTEIRSDVAARLGAVDGLVATRISDALPGLTESVTSTLTPRIDSARQGAVQDALAAAQRAIATADAAARADFAGQIADATATLSSQLQTQIGQRLAAELATTTAAIAANGVRIDGLTTQANRLESTQASQALALAAIPQQIVALRVELRDTLLAEISLQTTLLTNSLNEQLVVFQKTQNDQLTTMAADIQLKATDEARRVAVETAQAESRTLRTQLLAETRAIAREEVSGALRDQVRLTVDAAVREQFAAVPGMVATEVRRVTSTTTTTTTTPTRTDTTLTSISGTRLTDTTVIR
jgi:hypothetical protein